MNTILELRKKKVPFAVVSADYLFNEGNDRDWFIISPSHDSQVRKVLYSLGFEFLQGYNAFQKDLTYQEVRGFFQEIHNYEYAHESNDLIVYQLKGTNFKDEYKRKIYYSL